jgi:hypothetical protein
MVTTRGAPHGRGGRGPVHAVLLAALAAGACGEPAGPVPAAGPHFSVSPIPVDVIARITVLGSDSKVWPTPHTYWLTCDFTGILPSGRPCVRERLPIVAPGSGVVRDVNPAEDGFLAVEGPPGLHWTFGHVTPRPGLVRGSRIAAGDTIATMAFDHGFDFGLWNTGVTHEFVAPHRYHPGYMHAEHPIAQFPEPLGSALAERVPSMGDGLGRLSWDVAGTAAGNWVIAGAPGDGTVLEGTNGHMLLHLGRFPDRIDTRVFVAGEMWPGMPNPRLALDVSEPSWESITPVSGAVSLRLWNLGVDGLPQLDWPGGTLRLELLHAGSLLVEWFDTHEPIDAFTEAARLYTR